jgi:NRAMP (natural resistance-associated macrophage protein)-like metal ion transporter
MLEDDMADPPTARPHALRKKLTGPYQGQPVPLPSLRRWLRVLGPGLITGAADDDPSGIGTYSQAGAAFGTGQLWLALYMLPLMIAVQEMCGRIGLVTGKGIAAVIKIHYSRSILITTVVLVLLANTINIGADLGAMAATIQLLVPGVSFIIWLLITSVGILLLEVFVPYRRYAVVLKILALSLLAYVITGFIIGPRGGALLRATVIPTIQLTPAFLALVVGVLGTTISPYLFFWQASEEVEELDETALQQAKSHIMRPRRDLPREIRLLRADTTLGMLASEITTWFILFTTGSVLFTHGITNISTPDQAAAALGPLAGVWAKEIFALGIIGVGLLGVPVLAGSAAYSVAEVFGWNEGLGQQAAKARGFYGVIALATLVGMGLNLLGINPIAALVYAAVINGVVAVPLLVIILLVANNRAIMKGYTNGKLSNIVGSATALLMGAAAVAAIVLFFWH